MIDCGAIRYAVSLARPFVTIEPVFGRAVPFTTAIAAFAAAAWLLRTRRSRAVIAWLIFSALACVGSFAALHITEQGSAGRALAIVTANKMEARLAAADNAGTVLALPAGSEIKILRTRGDWVYAVLPNDLRGWIPAQSAERVRL